LGVGLVVLVVVSIAWVLLGRATAPQASGVASLDGSARAMLAGIPVSHPRSRAGAIAAAADYAQALAVQAMTDDQHLVDAQRATFTSGALQRLAPRVRMGARTTRAALALTSSSPATPDIEVRHVPIAARLLRFRPDRADVGLWSVDVAAPRGGMARAIWMTERLSLRWSRGRWRIASARGGSGPVPAAGQRQPSSAAALREQLTVMKSLRHAG
jgi:hypothetical protein